MRFINCPNCLSSHPDDHLERQSTIVTQSLNHRKRSRLYNITKALFSPTNSFNTHNTNNTKSTKKHPNNKTETSCTQFPSKYCIERKHKIKKRDLVKQNHPKPSQYTGKYCFFFLLQVFDFSLNFVNTDFDAMKREWQK